MHAGDGSPNDALLVALGISLLAAIHKSDTLAKIPLGVSSRVHILQLDDRAAGILIALRALISQMTSLDVHADKLVFDSRKWILHFQHADLDGWMDG